MKDLERRLHRLEQAIPADDTVCVAGITLPGDDLTALLRRIDGRTRGLPSSHPASTEGRATP